MMNLSYEESHYGAVSLAVTAFAYRDMSAPAKLPFQEPELTEVGEGSAGIPSEVPTLPLHEIEALLSEARMLATTETEDRLVGAYEAKFAQEADKIREALELFQVERKNYFLQVEADIVRLALGISSKILHRESQVDPMLIAALVRVAVDKMHDGSSVTVRVSPVKASKWREYLANPLNGSTIAFVEDANLGAEDCILETILGSANFSIEAQLKEVEQGFFDLLARRPSVQ